MPEGQLRAQPVNSSGRSERPVRLFQQCPKLSGVMTSSAGFERCRQSLSTRKRWQVQRSSASKMRHMAQFSRCFDVEPYRPFIHERLEGG